MNQTANVEAVTFVEREVKMEIGKGRGVWFCVRINGKKFVMKEVEKFYFEGSSASAVEEAFGK